LPPGQIPGNAPLPHLLTSSYYPLDTDELISYKKAGCPKALTRKFPGKSPRFNAIMPYVLTFSIMVLVGALLCGRFTIRRHFAGRRNSFVLAGAVDESVQARILNFDQSNPLPHVPVSNGQTINSGTEYYFNSKLGLLTIVPYQGLPSAVELRIGGKIWASYISAEFAANAVGSSLTNHKELDALPAECRPAKLGDWEQSRPHHFRT
jgi:hypothetical protein